MRPDFGLNGTYTLVKHLGRGGTGDTWLGKTPVTDRFVAIKFIKRPVPRVLMATLLREFTIQADLGWGHANVIKAFEALLTPTHLALVMEFAAGGSLTSYVAERFTTAQHTGLFLTEDEARYFFKQFLSAVDYCHEHCVAHRDLKLDNTLLDGSDPPVLKICDFGFAKTWSEDANMYTHIGTPVYMSPELINSRNGVRGYDGRSVDVWASGVLLIVMLLGTFPFDHTEHPDPNTSEAHLEVWLQQVSKRWSELPHIAGSVKKLSDECTDLLNRIFVIDEKKRITVPEIEQHPWYQKPLLPRYQEALSHVQQDQGNLNEYIAKRKLDPKLVLARNKALQEMVNTAGLAAPAGSKEVERVNLREEPLLMREDPLNAVPEDEEAAV